MKSIYVCQIYDSLSEKVIHTFMASGTLHARDQFRRFLESVKKFSDPKNFYLFYCANVDICESCLDCEEFIGDDVDGNGDVDTCETCGFFVEENENESEN